MNRSGSVDHRRAIAERNAAGILDATERLLARGESLNMRAIAAEAGVSRPTLYAHYKTIGDVFEAAVERSVVASLAAFEAARLDEGPAQEALERMLAASWSQLARFENLARSAAEHLTPGSVHRTHEAMMAPLLGLVERGRREGVFRTDMPAEWLASLYLALVHGAHDHARAHGMDGDAALALLTASVRDLFAARPQAISRNESPSRTREPGPTGARSTRTSST
jgi:AcrR family transcriptional regulator